MDAVVRLVDDFELDGTGAAPQWNHAAWWPLIPIKGPSTATTRVKLLYSSTGLYCHYDCEDHLIMCTELKDNDDLWNEDVIEAFFWPDQSQDLYLEYELSPLGVELPLIIPNHQGSFMGWSPWHYSGNRKIRRATSVRGGPKLPGATITGWSAEFFIPFALMQGMGNVPPKPGTQWRANFYRIDYDQNLQTLFAWAIGVNNSFHDFKRFGTITFEGPM
jgi:hypothetical protein